MIVNRQTTAIVVDSTADLPDHLAADPNISMVPLTVYFGEEAFLDWVEMKPAEFYRRLAAPYEERQRAKSGDVELYAEYLTEIEKLG